MKENKKYFGYKNQVYGVTSAKLQGGRKQDALVHFVKTGSGLEYVVNQDRCLDIASLSFGGINISYQGREGIINSKYANTFSSGAFDTYYNGGMIYTCGLKNVGPECICNNEFYPTHGRIGTLPANDVSIISNDEEIKISGTIYETSLFGSNLVLNRTIKSNIFSNELELSDIIENNGNIDENIYYLYHMNFGYPFLDENTIIECDEQLSTPRDEYSNKNLYLLTKHDKPYDDVEECVFFRKLKDENGISRISVINKKMRIKATIEYENEFLPNLVQWSSLVSHDYALGLEPTNTFVRGRNNEIENGNVHLLKKNEKIKINIKLKFERI